MFLWNSYHLLILAHSNDSLVAPSRTAAEGRDLLLSFANAQMHGLCCFICRERNTSHNWRSSEFIFKDVLRIARDQSSSAICLPHLLSVISFLQFFHKRNAWIGEQRISNFGVIFKLLSHTWFYTVDTCSIQLNMILKCSLWQSLLHFITDAWNTWFWSIMALFQATKFLHSWACCITLLSFYIIKKIQL